ncbi:MAG: 6-hydroxymethylpterin diphosphokinase MptE-like protein, partial [Spirochaeta sp.]
MREFPNDTLSKNLLALSGFNLHEATSIGDTHPSDSLLFNTAKSGQLVPVIQSSGRPRPLHSQFDPLREASRLASQVSTGGFVIVLGFGGGYHIRELLQNQAVESILIVDFEYPCMRSILSHIDVSDIFVDSRVRFFIDPSVEDIRNYLLERYIPALMGDIRSLELRSRTLMLPELFNSILEVLTQTIRTVSEDYSVQARFGRRWMSNTMANLAISDRHSITIPPRRKVMIAAAGPSLDQNLALIKSTAAEYYCIATDTSLPWLLKHNILPDIVLSIDCQLVTYHHFFTELPDSIPVLFDLASPPTLTRRIRNTLFFSSGHPFSQ